MTTIFGCPKKRGKLTFSALLFTVVFMLALVIAAPASAVDAVYEGHTTGDDSALGFYFQWQAQTFTTTSEHTVNAVSLKLFKAPTCTGTMTVSIRATDANGYPTGGDLCLGTVEVPELPTSGAWYKIPMNSSYLLNDSTTYAVVVRKNSWGTGNLLYWNFSRNDRYSGGSSYTEQNGNGANFYPYIGDFMFQIYGDPPDDDVAPTVTLNQTPSVWTNGDVTVTAAVTDSGSGVDVVKWAAGELTAGHFAAVTTILTSSTNDYAFDVSANGWYTVYAKDVAGNETVDKIQISNIDKVAPTVTAINGAAYTGGPVNLGYIARDFDKAVSYEATDNLSGFVSSGTIEEAGSFTINTAVAGLDLSQTGYVTDRAGNQASITFDYNVIALDDFMEMLKPAANKGVYKRNSNLPVKLAIFADGGIQQQMSAGDLTLILDLYKYNGSDWAATPFSRTNSSTLGDAEFKLSSDGYQYQFNLSTKGLDLGEYKLEILIPAGGSCGYIEFTLR